MIQHRRTDRSPSCGSHPRLQCRYREFLDRFDPRIEGMEHRTPLRNYCQKTNQRIDGLNSM